MPAPHLYLDTARLGRMTPAAQRAQVDFARLAGAEGASAALDRFLRSGFAPGDGAARAAYPGLASWEGVAALKRSLRLLVGHRPDLPVLLASRSAELMRCAARLLFRTCHHVLTTDLGWPDYHAILMAEAQSGARRVTSVPLRDAALRGELAEDAVVEEVRRRYVDRECDGLLLTAVSHIGLRLPVERIVRAIEVSRPARFVVVDGAQDFCHTTTYLWPEFCDLYLAGSHKWLGAYHPLGIGFYGRRRSESRIETVVGRLLRGGHLDDPLLRFTSELEGDPSAGPSETVNVAALFACQGAITDARSGDCGSSARFGQRLANGTAAADRCRPAGWHPLLPHPSLRTGILLLEAERKKARQLPAAAVRAAFHDRGVSLTAYDAGRVRLSMPDRPWAAGELDLLASACRHLA